MTNNNQNNASPQRQQPGRKSGNQGTNRPGQSGEKNQNQNERSQ